MNYFLEPFILSFVLLIQSCYHQLSLFSIIFMSVKLWRTHVEMNKKWLISCSTNMKNVTQLKKEIDELFSTKCRNLNKLITIIVQDKHNFFVYQVYSYIIPIKSKTSNIPNKFPTNNQYFFEIENLAWCIMRLQINFYIKYQKRFSSFSSVFKIRSC